MVAYRWTNCTLHTSSTPLEWKRKTQPEEWSCGGALQWLETPTTHADSTAEPPASQWRAYWMSAGPLWSCTRRPRCCVPGRSRSLWGRCRRTLPECKQRGRLDACTVYVWSFLLRLWGTACSEEQGLVSDCTVTFTAKACKGNKSAESRTLCFWFARDHSFGFTQE